MLMTEYEYNETLWCYVQWIRRGIADCRRLGIVPFVKQLGSLPHTEHPGIEWKAFDPVYDDALELKDKAGADPDEWPVDLQVREFPEPHHAR